MIALCLRFVFSSSALSASICSSASSALRLYLPSAVGLTSPLSLPLSLILCGLLCFVRGVGSGLGVERELVVRELVPCIRV